MSKRFSEEELYEVRNKLPIRHVIEHVLKLPSKLGTDKFRFSCPKCACFETGINGLTNLSRCFACAKNFNTIDVVMEYQKLTFVESVKFLQAQIQESVQARTWVANFIKQQVEQKLPY